MSKDLTRRVVARVAEQTHHDPTEGVFTKSDYDHLENPSAWKGYSFKLSTWTWAADVYEDQDEPDDWGSDATHSAKTLEEALKGFKDAGHKGYEWLDKTDGSFQSNVKKTKKTVSQIVGSIHREDDRKLCAEEIDFIESTLRI